MTDKVAYSFRTLGTAGQIEIVDGVVHSNCKFGTNQVCFSIPLAQVSQMPIRTRLTTRGFVILVILAMAYFGIGAAAIIDRQAFWLNLPAGLAMLVVGGLCTWMAFRHCREDWILFPTDSPLRTIAFARGRDRAQQFEHFAELISARGGDAVRKMAN